MKIILFNDLMKFVHKYFETSEYYLCSWEDLNKYGYNFKNSNIEMEIRIHKRNNVVYVTDLNLNANYLFPKPNKWIIFSFTKDSKWKGPDTKIKQIFFTLSENLIDEPFVKKLNSDRDLKEHGISYLSTDTDIYGLISDYFGHIHEWIDRENKINKILN